MRAHTASKLYMELACLECVCTVSARGPEDSVLARVAEREGEEVFARSPRHSRCTRALGRLPVRRAQARIGRSPISPFFCPARLLSAVGHRLLEEVQRGRGPRRPADGSRLGHVRLANGHDQPRERRYRRAWAPMASHHRSPGPGPRCPTEWPRRSTFTRAFVSVSRAYATAYLGGLAFHFTPWHYRSLFCVPSSLCLLRLLPSLPLPSPILAPATRTIDHKRLKLRTRGTR